MYLTWECAPPFEYCNFQKKTIVPGLPLQGYPTEDFTLSDLLLRSTKFNLNLTSTEGDPISLRSNNSFMTNLYYF